MQEGSPLFLLLGVVSVLQLLGGAIDFPPSGQRGSGGGRSEPDEGVAGGQLVLEDFLLVISQRIVDGLGTSLGVILRWEGGWRLGWRRGSALGVGPALGWLSWLHGVNG